MHISPLEEYGLRCAVQLAMAGKNSQLSASTIAKREGISNEYASKIMFLFKKAGLIKANRGAQGGFKLAREPKEIPLKDILDALQQKKKLSSSFCDQFTGQLDSCIRIHECSVRPVWNVIADHINKLLTVLTLEDLAHQECMTQQRIHTAITDNQFKVPQTLLAPPCRKTAPSIESEV